MNSAVIHLMGFLVLLATVQLWTLLHLHPRLQVIGRTLTKAWDEVVGFLLVIVILLTGYAMAVSLPQCLFPGGCGLGVTLPSLEKITIWKIISSSWHRVLEKKYWSKKAGFGCSSTLNSRT